MEGVITEEAVVVIDIIVDAVEAEDGEAVTNLTTTTDLATTTIMVVAAVVDEAEGAPEIDLVPIHLPSKIRTRP